MTSLVFILGRFLRSVKYVKRMSQSILFQLLSRVWDAEWNLTKGVLQHPFEKGYHENRSLCLPLLELGERLQRHPMEYVDVPKSHQRLLELYRLNRELHYRGDGWLSL